MAEYAIAESLTAVSIYYSEMLGALTSSCGSDQVLAMNIARQTKKNACMEADSPHDPNVSKNSLVRFLWGSN